MVRVELPWPPSVNNYYRNNNGRFFITAKGIEYRVATALICLEHKHVFDKDDRLSVTIYAYAPDNRKRDIDNILKCLLDSLEKAQVFPDDSQIDELIVRRFKPNDGKVIVNIKCC